MAAQAQNLYDPTAIQEIRVNFYQSNWDHLLDSLKAIDQGDYLLVPSVEINGVLFDSCGVKYKGNSSYNDDNAKNPLHIELDFVRKNQAYQGYQDIKLSNCFSDPTFVREAVSYDILRRYMHAPEANHAKLWLNGVYAGVYTNVESINRRFVRRHFFSDGDNAFFKCNPEDFAGPGTGGNYPDLVYSSADSAFYYNKYDIRSDYGWRELLALMDTLKNHPNSAEKVLDLDRVLWMLAFNNLMVNLDSYTGAFAQNYYLYRDDNGRFVPISWDLNMSFGAFPLLSTGGGMLSLTQMKQLDPLVQANNANRPLIRQLLATPRWRRMYLAHLRTMLSENIINGHYLEAATERQALISADVEDDPNKFYSFAAFQANLNQTVNSGGVGFPNIPGLSDLMSARVAYLATNSNISNTAPSISNVQASTDGTLRISAEIAGANAAFLGWRYDSAAIFQKTPLLDDGLHFDGAAGDGIYGTEIPVLGFKAQYYLYAENDNAGRFAPERAEHEFFLASTLPPFPNVGDVVINELLADNEDGQTDEAGEHEDWVELHNNTDSPLSLTGLYLSDNPGNPEKWPFPANVSIPANGYLVVWLDEDGLQGPLHADFRLSNAGEFLMLSDGSGYVLDSLRFGPQLPDISWGRFPNGTGPFQFLQPSFSAFNGQVSAGEADAGAWRVFPNPARAAVQVQGTAPIGALWLTDGLGRRVFEAQVDDFECVVPTRHLPAGLYFLHIGQGVWRVWLL
jgi:hypothetical protein